MDESEDNMSSEDIRANDSSLNVKNKPKKRSLIERELETNLTTRITSPATIADGASTSRYGRARRLKSELDQPDTKKITELKSPITDKSPIMNNAQSPVYKMHASNSPLKRTESPKKVGEESLDSQIESIYQENISLSRFSNDNVSSPTTSPAKKFPKVYIRKDLIQKREPEETVMVIQNLFSPMKSTRKSSNTHLNNVLERSSERYSLNSKSPNNYLGNSSVVKALDFDSKKKNTPIKDIKPFPSKSELFEMEAKCSYQVGDLAWARMGTYPFWPSIVTRDPSTGIFVKKKMFGRIERDVIHVTFFGDNGRRGWIVENMLRKYLGQLEFEATRENFTPEAKKKDPKLYAAHFVSEKKLPSWSTSVEEAEMLLREPKRLRIDIFNDMLEKSRSFKVKQPRSKMSRTDSDVSLSESLYDSLFSEDDGKSDNIDRNKSRSRKKSLDVFEVVTACLDNMAAKTGMTKIQRQSHMDRWLQKAKSKTPEKTKAKSKEQLKKEEKKDTKLPVTKKRISSTPKKSLRKSVRNSIESHNLLVESNPSCSDLNSSQETNEICVISKVESLAKKAKSDDSSMETSNKETNHSESVKESSQDTSELCESETYTDEFDKSIIDPNNTTSDEGKLDFSISNSDAVSKDFISGTSCSTVNEEKSNISAANSETMSINIISEGTSFTGLQESSKLNSRSETEQIATQNSADTNASITDLCSEVDHCSQNEKRINNDLQSQSNKCQIQNKEDLKTPIEEPNINLDDNSVKRDSVELKRYSTRNSKVKMNEIVDISHINLTRKVDPITHTAKNEKQDKGLDSDSHNSQIQKTEDPKTPTEDLNSKAEKISERQDGVEFKRYSTRNRKSIINEITDTSQSNVIKEVAHINDVAKDEKENSCLDSDFHSSHIQKAGYLKTPIEDLNSKAEFNSEDRGSVECKRYSTRNRKSKINEIIDTSESTVITEVDQIIHTDSDEKDNSSSHTELYNFLEFKSERGGGVDSKRYSTRNRKSKIHEIADTSESNVMTEVDQVILNDKDEIDNSSLHTDFHNSQIQKRGDPIATIENHISKVEFKSERGDSVESKRYSTRNRKSKIHEITDTSQIHVISEVDQISHTGKDEKENSSLGSDSHNSQIQKRGDSEAPTENLIFKVECKSERRVSVGRYSSRHRNSRINEITNTSESNVTEIDKISHTDKNKKETSSLHTDSHNSQVQKGDQKTPVENLNSTVECKSERRDSVEPKRHSSRHRKSRINEITDTLESNVITEVDQIRHTDKIEKVTSSLHTDSHNSQIHKGDPGTPVESLNSKVECKSERRDSVESKRYSSRHRKSKINEITDTSNSEVEHISDIVTEEKENSRLDSDSRNIHIKKRANLKTPESLNSVEQDSVESKRYSTRQRKSKNNENVDIQHNTVVKELGDVNKNEKRVGNCFELDCSNDETRKGGNVRVPTDDLNIKLELNSERRNSVEIKRNSRRNSKIKINEIIENQPSVVIKGLDHVFNTENKAKKEIVSSLNSESQSTQFQTRGDLKALTEDLHSKVDFNNSEGRDSVEVKRHSTRNSSSSKSKINEIVDSQHSIVANELNHISHTGNDQKQSNSSSNSEESQIKRDQKTILEDFNSKVDISFERRSSFEVKRYATRNKKATINEIMDNQPSVVIKELDQISHTGKAEKEIKSSIDSDSHSGEIHETGVLNLDNSNVELNSERRNSIDFERLKTRSSKSKINEIFDTQHTNLVRLPSPNIETKINTTIVETNTEIESQNLKPDKCVIPGVNQKQEDSKNALSETGNVNNVTLDENVNTTNKNVACTQENELDYYESDSDSERLPYSPLSNLGNESGDDLRQDVAMLENEIKNQCLESINEKNTDVDCNKIDHKLIKINISHGNVDEKITRKIMESCEQNKLREFDSSVREKITENGHVSDNEVHAISKIENIRKEEPIEQKVLINGFGDDYTQDNIHSINHVYREDKVMEIEMASKEIRIYVSDCQKEQLLMKNKPAIKENGFHGVNGRIDLETASIHSEDSALSTRSDSRCRLRSKPNKMTEDPLLNSEFLKYMELRQDSIMDENPDLKEHEIVAYLYKTWLYEENAKSDVIKNDDLKDINLVKGLNHIEPVTPTRSKRNLSLNKRQTPKTNTMERYLRNRKDEICSNKDNDISVKTDEDRDCVQKDADLPLSHSAEDNDMKDTNKQIEDDLNNSIDSSVVSDANTDLGLSTEEAQEPITLEPSTETLQSSSTNVSKELSLDDTKIEQQKEILTKPLNPIKEYLSVFCEKIKEDIDQDSIDSEDSETPLIRCKLRSNAKKQKEKRNDERKIKDEDADTVSLNSEDSEISVTKRKKKLNGKKNDTSNDDPEFIKYLELRQDVIIDEHPELTYDEIVAYLYKTWLYEENNKSETKKNDELQQSSLVKGHNDAILEPKKVKRKVTKTEKTEKDDKKEDIPTKDKPKRKSVKPFYNEEYSDIEEELEVFEIFKPKNKGVVPSQSGQSEPVSVPSQETLEVYDEIELYFAELTKPKPNVFKGIIREKMCEICEKPGHLVKCKGCNDTFHIDCVKKQVEVVEVAAPNRGKKKKKKLGRVGRPKNSEEFDTDKSQDTIEDNASIEELIEPDFRAVDEDAIEALLSAKMKEIIDSSEKVDYESYSSDDGLDWNEAVPGKCEIVDVKLKPRTSNSETNSDFKCNNCQQYDTPICFVCKNAVSKQEVTKRQKCHVAHCNKYYHIQCLDHWPQTQFNGCERSKTNKKINEYFEALTCPRHVCHTCVSDDPRGCKTRFSGDKLARCVRCPATYHSFTKCLPAGTQILSASHIICPRHHEHRPGKVPCHVNTGWCFICALGGSLICCEYCPTSFHAECLNIDPPEGGYMCEDCETGRLPLYGEMVWVKLGHYRWWPGIILHPYEIPENLLAVKHSLGEFVVRFFGQYDHYWVNRGRVFPFQEGDSGRISGQKSKIDAAFTTAMEHAQRACEILKKAQPNEEESLDIASSLLPPHFVRLKVNKPCGSLCGWKLEDPESSLTQCECNPHEEDPCGPYSQCLNRMLLTECGPTCRAGDRCNNRAFEKRLYPKLVPYKTPSRGWGLKTLEDIKSGQFVIEYVGELIDMEEFRRRMRRKHEVRDENFYFLTLDKERMIDAGPKGNLARFMNHCCEPNCETQKWTVLGDVRVGLFALYDIPAHSEVTFNYNLECAGIDKKRCMCGAKRCSGYIGAKPKQDESQTKKNKVQQNKRPHSKKRKPEESPSTKTKQKRPLGRPPKPKELTEIEKDLLIIRNATNSVSSDENIRNASTELDKNPKALKRKRVSFSTEEVTTNDGTESPNIKKSKLDDELKGD